MIRCQRQASPRSKNAKPPPTEPLPQVHTLNSKNKLPGITRQPEQPFFPSVVFYAIFSSNCWTLLSIPSKSFCMRLGFEESVAIVADFLYSSQPQVQQIISPTSVLAVHFLWSRFLPRGPLQEYCPKRKDLVAVAVEALKGRGYPISVS